MEVTFSIIYSLANQTQDYLNYQPDLRILAIEDELFGKEKLLIFTVILFIKMVQAY